MRNAAIAVAIVAVGLGVGVPSIASLLAVLLTVALAVALAATAFGGERRVAAGTVTPFAPAPVPGPPTVETPDVLELIREVESSRNALTPRLVGVVREIARGRLRDHHDLDVRRVDDADRARVLLGADLAALVLDDAPVELSATSLDSLLTRLEAL